MTSSQTFLGMTKDQLKTAAIAVLFAIVTVQGFELWQALGLVEQGVQTHQAVCVQKRDYQRQVSQSKKFLRMSMRQRERRYGVALGAIPNSVIRHGLVQQEANVNSLASLSC
jgi:hypothetical protein